MTNQTSAEPILEPDLLIVDAHHHLWLQPEAALTAMDTDEATLSRLVGPARRCANVGVKLGGLGMALGGFGFDKSIPPATSSQLAEAWRPYIETCIEAFAAYRCMFEGNLPMDSPTCSYPLLWNAFKRIAAAASSDEKTVLFNGTAQRIYRLNI